MGMEHDSDSREHSPERKGACKERLMDAASDPSVNYQSARISSRNSEQSSGVHTGNDDGFEVDVAMSSGDEPRSYRLREKDFGDSKSRSSTATGRNGARSVGRGGGSTGSGVVDLGWSTVGYNEAEDDDYVPPGSALVGRNEEFEASDDDDDDEFDADGEEVLDEAEFEVVNFSEVEHDSSESDRDSFLEESVSTAEQNEVQRKRNSRSRAEPGNEPGNNERSKPRFKKTRRNDRTHRSNAPPQTPEDLNDVGAEEYNEYIKFLSSLVHQPGTEAEDRDENGGGDQDGVPKWLEGDVEDDEQDEDFNYEIALAREREVREEFRTGTSARVSLDELRFLISENPIYSPPAENAHDSPARIHAHENHLNEKEPSITPQPSTTKRPPQSGVTTRAAHHQLRRIAPLLRGSTPWNPVTATGTLPMDSKPQTLLNQPFAGAAKNESCVLFSASAKEQLRLQMAAHVQLLIQTALLGAQRVCRDDNVVQNALKLLSQLARKRRVMHDFHAEFNESFVMSAHQALHQQNNGNVVDDNRENSSVTMFDCALLDCLSNLEAFLDENLERAGGSAPEFIAGALCEDHFATLGADLARDLVPKFHSRVASISLERHRLSLDSARSLREDAGKHWSSTDDALLRRAMEVKRDESDVSKAVFWLTWENVPLTKTSEQIDARVQYLQNIADVRQERRLGTQSANRARLSYSREPLPSERQIVGNQAAASSLSRTEWDIVDRALRHIGPDWEVIQKSYLPHRDATLLQRFHERREKKRKQKRMERAKKKQQCT